MKYNSGICAICGADSGLHQSETERCPLYGREETNPTLPQRWDDDVFVDSGINKLQDSAPELLEALEKLYLSVYGGNSKDLEDCIARASHADEFEKSIISVINRAKGK